VVGTTTTLVTEHAVFHPEAEAACAADLYEVDEEAEEEVHDFHGMSVCSRPSVIMSCSTRNWVVVTADAQLVILLYGVLL